MQVLMHGTSVKIVHAEVLMHGTSVEFGLAGTGAWDVGEVWHAVINAWDVGVN